MSWMSKTGVAQYGFLGDEMIAYRAVDLSRAEEALLMGFQNSQYFTPAEDRAVFYANFTNTAWPGAIFECKLDTSRSSVDMNDASVSQSEDTHHSLSAAASEIYRYLAIEGVKIDVDIIYNFIGSSTNVEGYYDQVDPSLWLFIASESGISPHDAAQIIPPGRYGDFFTLDNRGVFGVDDSIASEQLQYDYAVPPENIIGVYLHSSLIDALEWKWERNKFGHPVSNDYLVDSVSVIPAQVPELLSSINSQLENFPLKEMIDDEQMLFDVFDDDDQMHFDEERYDSLESIKNRLQEGIVHGEQSDSVYLNGNLYRKLYEGEELTPDDLNATQQYFLRFELPANRMRVLFAIRWGTQ